MAQKGNPLLLLKQAETNQRTWQFTKGVMLEYQKRPAFAGWPSIEDIS